MWLVLIKYTNLPALGEQALLNHGTAGIPAKQGLQELSDQFSQCRQTSSIFEIIAQVSIYNCFLAAEDKLLKNPQKNKQQNTNKKTPNNPKSATKQQKEGKQPENKISCCHPGKGTGLHACQA